MPDKSYRSVLFRKLAGGLLIFLFVLLGAECFSRWLSTISMASFGDNIRVDQKILISDYSTDSAQIVALGDSVIARDFYPELFAALLSNKASIAFTVYNLGVEGTGMYWFQVTFDHLVKKRKIPKIVILNISVHNLSGRDYVPYFDNSLDYYNGCLVYRDREELAATLYCKLAKHSYFLRLLHFYRKEINDSENVLLDSRKIRYTNLILDYPSVSSMGFSPNYGVLTQKAAQSDYLHKAMMNIASDSVADFKLSTSRLDKLLDDLNKHSVKVILVLMPAYQPVMRGVYDKYHVPANRVIIKTLEQYSIQRKIAFINLFDALQDPINFQDPIHMNVIGATKATELIASKILSKQYLYPKGYLDKEIYQYQKKEK